MWREPQADISHLSLVINAVDPAAGRHELEQLSPKDCDRGLEPAGFLCP
ncbi:hypothetical protein WDV91_01895 [Curtobacterium flaccumfaciens pv. flaccumfaciens]